MRTISDEQITELIQQARDSERKRAIFRLHEHEEPVQRMVNAVIPGTYVTPHKHQSPPKVELLSILRGRVALLRFDDEGGISEIHILDENGPVKVIDIAPGEYHSMVALVPSAVLEIVQGPFDPVTHKQFADFAPHEGQPGTTEYLAMLEEQIRKS